MDSRKRQESQNKATASAVFIIDHVCTEGNAVGSVRLSIRPFVSTHSCLLNRLSFDLELLREYGSWSMLAWDWRSRSRSKVVTRSAGHRVMAFIVAKCLGHTFCGRSEHFSWLFVNCFRRQISISFPEDETEMNRVLGLPGIREKPVREGYNNRRDLEVSETLVCTTV